MRHRYDFETCPERKGMDAMERACWDVGVALQDGRLFHGAFNLRMNLALPTSRTVEAFDRLGKYVLSSK